MNNKIPRVACINDLSGYGRCSLTTAISILSVLGVQPCPVPTAVLSKHTAFPTFYFKDLTESMEEYLADWSTISFDGIYSGFLGSLEQIQIVYNFIKSTNSNSLIVIDPVMGDWGKMYSTYTVEMCKGMKRLVASADVIIPNITEACILTDMPYTGDEISLEVAEQLAKKLLSIGTKSVVITGIRQGNNILNFSYDGEYHVDKIERVDKVFSGTGDMFASIVCGLLVKGNTLQTSVKRAARFIYEAASKTIENNSDITEGVQFEPYLGNLLK